MDLHMPIMDGIRATAILRRVRPHLPVVAVTADVTSDMTNRCRSVGILQVVHKVL